MTAAGFPSSRPRGRSLAALVRELHAAGKSRAEVLAALGCSRQVYEYALTTFERTPGRPGPKRRPTQLDATIISLAALRAAVRAVLAQRPDLDPDVAHTLRQALGE